MYLYVLSNFVAFFNFFYHFNIFSEFLSGLWLKYCILTYRWRIKAMNAALFFLSELWWLQEENKKYFIDIHTYKQNEEREKRRKVNVNRKTDFCSAEFKQNSKITNNTVTATTIFDAQEFCRVHYTILLRLLTIWRMPIATICRRIFENMTDDLTNLEFFGLPLPLVIIVFILFVDLLFNLFYYDHFFLLPIYLYKKFISCLKVSDVDHTSCVRVGLTSFSYDCQWCHYIDICRKKIGWVLTGI